MHCQFINAFLISKHKIKKFTDKFPSVIKDDQNKFVIKNLSNNLNRY